MSGSSWNDSSRVRTAHPLGNSIQGLPHPHDEKLKQGHLSRAFWQAPFPLFAFLPDMASDFLTSDSLSRQPEDPGGHDKEQTEDHISPRRMERVIWKE